jgi:ChrR Cupin-like domain
MTPPATPWMTNPVEGAAPGLTVKILRHVEETGEMTAIVANPPRFDYPVLEFHDCVEEMYLIEGDMRLANSGVMVPGTYLWRPGYITHGPFYSHLGSLMFLWTSSTLINHVPRDPAATPEENLEQARAEGTAV